MIEVGSPFAIWLSGALMGWALTSIVGPWLTRRRNRRSASESWKRLEDFVAEIEEDYAQPDYPRELLVEEIRELRTELEAEDRSEGKVGP